MFAFAVQFKHGPTKGSLVPAFLAILVFAIVGLAVYWAMEHTIPRLRNAVRNRRQRRRELESAASAETRCRAQMDELCPDGWQAQITVFSSSRDLPPEAPRRDRVRVALDWAPLSPFEPEPLAERRIWADSVRDAMEAMVADRMTEETLQQIERQALADGAEWPDQ